MPPAVLSKPIITKIPPILIKRKTKVIESAKGICKIDGKIVYDINKYEIYAYLTLSKAINVTPHVIWHLLSHFECV